MNIIFDGTQDTNMHRDVFANNFNQFIKDDKDVICLNSDVVEPCGMTDIWKSNPTHVINCGISEANMIGLAAGLSLRGKKVYAQTFGCFATRRCYDQLFISIAYAGLDLKLMGYDPGVTAGFNGGTHMPFEDIALIRAIPKAVIVEASDSECWKNLINIAHVTPGLVYLRSTRKNYKKIYGDGWDFKLGGSSLLQEGTDVALFASGIMTGEALQAAQELTKKGISAAVVDLYSIKPIDNIRVREVANAVKVVITCDNHNVIGGLGDAVADVMMKNKIYKPYEKLGVNDVFGQVGPVPYLMEQYGLTAGDIVNAAIKLLS